MGANLMAKIRIKKEDVHYFFDQNLKPVQTAKPGDTVYFETMDCYANQIVSDHTDFKEIDMKKNNPMTGPLFIEGAAKGDILKVEILDIEVGESGVMTARRGEGLFKDLIERDTCKKIAIEDNQALFNGFKIPLKPMIGGIGVATPEPLKVTVPGRHGGNLDIKELTAGTVLYLPVLTEGALLSVGDVHGVQGDGESVICALEVDAVVTLTIDIIKDDDRKVPLPFLLTRESYIAISEAETLDEAAVQAGLAIHGFIKKALPEYPDEEIAMLISLCGDLKISQVVNDLKGCYFSFPRSIIDIDI